MDLMEREQRRNNSGKGNFLIAAGILLIMAASALVGYNIWDAKRAEEISNVIAYDLMEEIGDTMKDGLTALPYGTPDMQMPITIIDGYEYIGILEMPSLGLTLPVMNEWEPTIMQNISVLSSGLRLGQMSISPMCRE